MPGSIIKESCIYNDSLRYVVSALPEILEIENPKEKPLSGIAEMYRIIYN